MERAGSLATVLFTDVVGSTARAAELGNHRWRELLERHNAAVRRELDRFGGSEVNTVGDSFVATFERPAQAIRCASAVREAVRGLGLEIRAGLHTGELEEVDGSVGGIAVHTGARVAAQAAPGEVLVSSTVHDVVAGLGFEFEDRGLHTLKGVPGEWRLFGVTGLPSDADVRSRPRRRLPDIADQTVLPLGALTAGLVLVLAVFVLRYHLDHKAALAGAAMAGLAELGAVWRLRRSRRRKRMLRTMGYGGGILLAGAFAIGFAAPAPDPPRVLVVPFRGPASISETDGELLQGLAGLLREQLAGSAFLRPVPTLLVQDLYQAVGLGPEGPQSEEEAARLFEASGARYLALVTPAGDDSVAVELFASADDRRPLEDWRPLDRSTVGRLDPEGVFAAVGRSAHRLKHGLPTSPLARFEREPALDDVLPSGAEAYQDFLRGRQLYFFEDFPGARDALEEAVRKDSTFALAHAWLARVYDRLFDRRAEAELQAAQGLAPHASERDRDFIEANQLLVRKRHDELGRILPRLVEKHEEDSELLIQFGDMYHLLEDADRGALQFWDARLDLYRRLAAREPGNPTLHKELGTLWAQRGEWEAAEAEFARVVALNPYSADGYYNLGMLNRVLGRYDAALEYLSKADSLRPGFARDDLAFTLQELGRYREARGQLLRQVATPGANPANVVYAHVVLASLSLEAGDTVAARADVESATRLVGPRPGGDERMRQVVLFLRGELARTRGDEVALARVLSEMEAGGVETPELHVTRARLAFLTGDSAAGWREFDEAVKSATQSAKPTYLFELGEARRQAGDLAEAERTYRRVLEINPHFPRAHFGLGMAFAAAGDSVNARRHLGRFLEIWSGADSTLTEVRTAREMIGHPQTSSAGR